MHCIWISGYRNYELNVFNNNDPKIKVIDEKIPRG